MSYITDGTLSLEKLSIVNTPATLTIRGTTPVTGVIVKEGERMRYLYKAWVIKGDDVFEVPAFIAKDEVGAKVKAILYAKAEPDEVHVIAQLVGIVPAPEKDGQ